MIELTRGSKRRLSDTDENERITLRQMVLNMSICKLQKDQGRKEPALLRSVIITNTVRNIENEMDEEMMMSFNEEQYFPSYSPTTERHKDTNTSDQNQNQKDLKKITELIVSVESHSKLNANGGLSRNVKTPAKEPNRFGAIGDHRKGKVETKKDNTTHMKAGTVKAGILWDTLSLPTAFSTFSPVLESLEFENTFPDVDITLYDFDNTSSSFPSQVNSEDWRVFPSSCATEYERRKPDSFFEELDQIMQVLVGM